MNYYEYISSRGYFFGGYQIKYITETICQELLCVSDPYKVRSTVNILLCQRKSKIIFKVGTITTFKLQSNTKKGCDSLGGLGEGTLSSFLVSRVASDQSELL